jgi:hypothetical protein
VVEIGAGRSRREIGRCGHERKPWRGDLIPHSIAVILVCSLAALFPLAQASPPDATWIAGLYDAADYDDVVLLIILDTAAAQLLTDTEIRPGTRFHASCFGGNQGLISSSGLPAPSVRAPPTIA